MYRTYFYTPEPYLHRFLIAWMRGYEDWMTGRERKLVSDCQRQDTLTRNEWAALDRLRLRLVAEERRRCLG